jgi:carbamoyltransferase
VTKILGISAFYHDSAAAILVDGQIIAAAQEERFSRIKHTEKFPINAIRYCLEEAGLSLDELDAIVFYDKPFLKFERLLETYYAFAPKGLKQFVLSMPVWLKEKLFLKKMVLDGLKEVEQFDRSKLRLLFPEHHLSHAASAFYPSPFEEAAILTIDGVGEWATATISHGKGADISILKEMRFPHSVGLLYSAFTCFLGFRVNSGEYKLMGLAPYGNPDAEETQRFVQLIRDNLVTINEDGSIYLHQEYFQYATGLEMIYHRKWEQLFGFPAVLPDGEIFQHHCNLAYAIQQVTEEIVLKMSEEAKRITGCDNLCMSGGVALNCVGNGKLLKAGIFKEIYIQPASGDAGGALGAAIAAYHLYFGGQREIDSTNADAMSGSYLGPYFSEKEIIGTLKKQKAVYSKAADESILCTKIASLLAEGNVIGWFQGRMEFGPRALGNRSILADARNPEMQKKLNLKIKQREGFRPFAPAVLFEDAADYFEITSPSPYMLFTTGIKNERRVPLPPDYQEMDLWARLYQERSEIQAVTHLDFSARVQTVHQKTNPRFWHLLSAFKQKTGCPVLVNTSFNVRGEPVVCSPGDAYRCFMRTEMDYLVVGDYILKKTEQPDWDKKEKWEEKFKPD